MNRILLAHIGNRHRVAEAHLAQQVVREHGPQQGDRLQRLAQPHGVCQDAAPVLRNGIVPWHLPFERCYHRSLD